MKISTLLLAATAAAFVAAAAGCGWLLAAYMPGYSPLALFASGDIIGKFVSMLIILLMPATLVIGLTARRGRAEGPGAVLTVVALLSAGLGGLAALYGWMTIQQATRVTHTTDFAIVAPSYAEVLLSLSIALFGALIAQAFRARLARHR